MTEPVLIPVIAGRVHNRRVVAYATVDAADYELVADHEWRLHQGYVLCRSVRCSHAERIFLHRLLLGLGQDDGRQYADHINRDKLDNRRVNLRVVTRAQNNQNLAGRGRTSSHRGVSWNSARQKWVARAQNKPLGYFTDEKAAATAARAYRLAHMPFAEEEAA